MDKLKIVFVCHGNICRSPMAEFIFKKMLSDKGLSDRVSVISRATSDEEIRCGVGAPIYPPARAELIKNGIPFEERRATQLRREDYSEYGLFIAMDDANVRNMKRIFTGDADNKIYKLLSFADSGKDIADPWYNDRFDIAFNDIYRGCGSLLSHLLAHVLS